MSLQTRSFAINKHANLDRIPGKFAKKEDQPDSAPKPSHKDDLIDRMNIEQKNSIDEGNPFTIDVRPDFRPILLVIFYHVSQLYKDIEQKDHALISPASLTAYCLTIIYGHFLLSDYYIRQTKSAHARIFTSEHARRDFLKLIMSLPVPSFLDKILNIFTPTADPRRPNLEYIPSLAGHSFEHDFGRFFPVRIFMLAHHLASTSKQNDSPESVFSRLLVSEVTTGTGIYHTRISHYFGAFYNNTADVYTSRMFTAFQAMFNPAVTRALAQRFVYSPIYMAAFQHTADESPYTMLLNCDEDNIEVMTTFLESIARIVKTDIPTSGQLGSRYDSLSGLDIISHSYSIPSAPTAHLETTLTTAPIAIIPKQAKAYATAIKFLTARAFSNDTTFVIPTDTKTFDAQMYRVESGSHDHTKNKGPDNWILFNVKSHVTPSLRLFDPYDYNPATFHKHVISGLIIESFEIDGFSIPQPSFDSTLGEENSQFLQSAIPYIKIRPLKKYHDLHVSARTRNSDAHQKVSVSLYDMARNRLGFVDETVDNHAHAYATVGFSTARHVPWLDRIFSKFSFRTLSPGSSSDDPIPIPDEFITAWSPYSYSAPGVPQEPFARRTYMLLNFRTIYGTNVTLAEVQHYTKLIPQN